MRDAGDAHAIVRPESTVGSIELSPTGCVNARNASNNKIQGSSLAEIGGGAVDRVQGFDRGRSRRIIQLMPNWSCTWANRDAKKVSSIGIKTLPPLVSAA